MFQSAAFGNKSHKAKYNEHVFLDETEFTPPLHGLFKCFLWKGRELQV